jgi:ribosomal protein S18 acetylase RimI-like enzyme
MVRFPTAPVTTMDVASNTNTHPDSFFIRECHPEEAETLLALWAGTSPSVTDTIADIQGTIESPAFVLIAEADRRIVGSLIATFNGWRGNMYRIAVHPDYRRRGIGRALVKEGEIHLVRQGAKRITALVEEKYPWAIAFWSDVGYEIEPGIVRFFRNP